MSNHPDQAAAIQEGIRNNDLDAIEAAYEELAATELSTLLSQLATAIDEQRYEDAEIIFQEITNTYEEKRKKENTVSAQINAARTSQNSSLDTVQELTTYLREANRTRVQRTELISTVSAFLHRKLDNTDADDSSSSSVQSQSPSEIIDVVSRTRDRESEFMDVAESATETASTVSLPPSLKILQVSTGSGQIKEGEPVSLNAAIANVGGSTATDISVSLEAPEFITITHSETDISSLPANEDASISFTVKAETSGPHSVTITVDSAESHAAVTETIVATSGVTIPEHYQPYVDNNGVVTQPGLNEAVRAYLKNNLSSRYLNSIIRAYLSGDPITE